MTRRLMAVALASLTAACATHQQTASLECGAIGAGGGFLACKLAGGSDASCAATGGAVGLGAGAICYKLSDNLDKHRKELAGHENELDARLRYVKEVNTDSAKYNEDLKKQVATYTKHTDTVVQQVHDKEIDQKALEKEHADLDAAVKNANQQLAAQQEAFNYAQSLQASHPFNDPQLTAELQRQQHLLDLTRQSAQALAAQRQRV